MTHATENKLICPHCDAVVAFTPDGSMPVGDLICSNCGAVVQPPTRFNEVADHAKEIVRKAEKVVRKTLE